MRDYDSAYRTVVRSFNIDTIMDRYNAVNFALVYRRALTALFTFAPIALGLWGTWRTGATDWLVIGLLIAPLAYLMIRVALELIDLIADTLIPK